MRQLHYFAPEPLPRDPKPSICRRGCCWTPHGHSTVADGCKCHRGDPMADRVPIGQLRKLTARDGHHCIWTSTDTDRLVPQHRQGGMGGRPDKHRLANLLWLDSELNGHIESDPTLANIARAWGFKISLHANAEVIPVYRPHMHAWFVLEREARREISALEALDRMHGFYGDEYFTWKSIAERSPHAGILRLRGGR